MCASYSVCCVDDSVAGTCTGCDGSGAFEDMYTGEKSLVSNAVYEAALSERGAFYCCLFFAPANIPFCSSVIRVLLSDLGASSADCPIALKLSTNM